MVTAPALTLLFLVVVVSLGGVLVWMIWENERPASKPPQNGDRFG